MKRFLLLLVLLPLFISCNENAQREDTPYSNNDSRPAFLLSDTGKYISLLSKTVAPDQVIELYDKEGNTVYVTPRSETKTITYTNSWIDTTVKRKVVEVPPVIPPTDPPPNPGTRQGIVYEDGFERPDPGKLYANEQQWCCSYSVTSATDIVREGTRSVRMEHRGTDPVVSSGERVELKSTANFKSLPEVWYGYSIYFKAPWDAFSANEHLPQWHPQSNTGGMVLGMWTGKGTFDLKTNPSGGSSSSSLVSNAKKIVTNKWTDFVWHIKWGSPGLLEVWIDGELYYSKAITTSTSGIPYFKFGLNGGSYPVNLNRIFYMDALRIGNEKATYKDVAP